MIERKKHGEKVCVFVCVCSCDRETNNMNKTFKIVSMKTCNFFVGTNL